MKLGWKIGMTESQMFQIATRMYENSSKDTHKSRHKYAHPSLHAPAYRIYAPVSRLRHRSQRRLPACLPQPLLLLCARKALSFRLTKTPSVESKRVANTTLSRSIEHTLLSSAVALLYSTALHSTHSYQRDHTRAAIRGCSGGEQRA